VISAVHFLLTYGCNFSCDHCFVYGAPGAPGTFTIGRLRDALDELAGLGYVRAVCFEGGEPALYYHTLCAAVRHACDLGLETSIVTNAYWATSDEDASLWLEPLAEAGLCKLTLSDDELHYGDAPAAPPGRAVRAAEKLGVGASVIATASPAACTDASGAVSVSGGVMFRGRAVDKLAAGLPKHPWPTFDKCPHEDLRNPSRVHLDAYGNVHLCQGLCMGSAADAPLGELFRRYQPDEHPVVGPLVAGGPAELARRFGWPPEEGCVDACHLCYAVRRGLLDVFPRFLAPRQVYGL